MALKNYKDESVKSLMMLKLLIKKIQRGFTHSSKASTLDVIAFDDGKNAASMLPEDVKQGHFAVIAVKGGEPKRFIVELDYLTDPAFVKLLEDAEEEYGQQKGVLSVPCQPEELQTIIGDRRRRRMSTEW